MLFWIKRRVPAEHCCPLLKQKALTDVTTASSNVAWSKTMLADLPPSSREIRFVFVAAALMTAWPVAVEPVKAILSTRGDPAITCPTTAPLSMSLVTTFKAPGGNPASLSCFANSKLGPEQRWDGLRTTVQPTATPGGI